MMEIGESFFMKIREFDRLDAPTFLKRCEAFYSSGSTRKPFCRKTVEKTFARVIERHENLWGYLIVDSETMVAVGYALVTSYWCNEEGGNVLVLDELYIAPEYRHHGYGGRFLEWLEKEFYGRAVSVTLEVLTTNQDAQSLYHKEGLEPDGFVTYTKDL